MKQYTNICPCINNTTLSRRHWRVIIVAGMGFFTDAYDLFVIGIVTALLKPIWHLSLNQIAWLNAAALLAAALGSCLFGVLSDRYGRKKIYGLEIIILFFGAILSALSPNFFCLLLSRIIVGFGIGGDYPSSAVIASEHADPKNRGRMVLLVFAMQAVGLIVGPILASILLFSTIPHDLVWRLLLAAGALPAAAVFYFRRQLPDVVKQINVAVKATTPKKIERLRSKKWMIQLAGTAGAWFLLDIAFYGNGVSSTLILQSLNPHHQLIQQIMITAALFLCFAVPGYLFSAKYVDLLGRKVIQKLGFLMMGILFLLIGILPSAFAHLDMLILLFGASFFFVNFGPNCTTFLMPAEIFPAVIRARAHGVSAAIGKVGAFVGAIGMPILLSGCGVHMALIVMSLVAFFGALLTDLLIDMTGKSLGYVELKL